MNIIVCFTPLQILIALRVMEQYPGERFYGIVYNYTKLPKLMHYCEKLAERCEHVEFVLANARGKTEMYRYTANLLLRGLRLPKAKRLFIASLDLLDIHIMLWRQSRAEIITFDDGSLNLSPKSFRAMLAKQPGGLYRGLKRVFGFLGTPELLDRKQKHYSIYTLPNVMGESSYLSLFSDHVSGCERSATKTILLGQPIYEGGYGGLVRSQQLMQALVDQFAPDYYLPHPRETYQIEHCTYIKTNLIFEDWILDKLRNNPNDRYKIYTLCSTSAINLAGVEGLEFVALRPADSDLYDEVYALMHQLGHEVIDLSAL